MLLFLLGQLLPPALLLALTAWAGRRPGLRRCGWMLILGGGLLLQVASSWGFRPSLENPDSRVFWFLSRGSETDLGALLYRPPLYPFFLSLLPLGAVPLAQALLKAALGALVYRLARLAGAGVGTALWAESLFFLQAFWLSEPLRVLDTTLFTFFFLAAMVLAAETAFRAGDRPLPWPFLGLGAAMGLTTLTRQVADPALALLWAWGCKSLLFPRGLRGFAREARGEEVPPHRGRIRLWGAGFRHPDFRARLRLAAGGSVLALVLAGSGAVVHGVQTGVWKRSVALGVNLYTHSSYYRLADRRDPEWDWVEASLPGLRERLPPWDPAWRQDVPWDVNAMPHELARSLMAAHAKNEAQTADTADAVDAGTPAGAALTARTGTVAESPATPVSPSASALLFSDRELTRRYIAWVKAEPLAFLASGWNEARRLWSKAEEYYPEPRLTARRAASAGEADPGGPPLWAMRWERGLVYQPLWLLALIPCLAMCLRGMPGPASAGPLLAALLVYGTVLPLVQLGFTRYSLPLIPGWLALAAAGLSRFGALGEVWARRIGRGGRREGHPSPN